MMKRDTAPLLQRLRAKFIAVNMALAALVLIIAFATVCILDYRNDTEEVYDGLSAAVSRATEGHPYGRGWNDGRRGGFGYGETIGSGGDEADGESQDGGAGDGHGEYAPPQIGGGPHDNREQTLPTALYYTDGSTAYQLLGLSSASIPDSVFEQAMTGALSGSDARGFLPGCDLFYVRSEVGSGWLIAFADGAAASAWQPLAWGLALVGLGALAVLFLLNLVFSRWALRPVQQAWDQQQRFVADASHELKTPLTVILANNAILRSQPQRSVADQMQWVESTQNEAERMQSLVADMLDLARSQAETAAGKAAGAKADARGGAGGDDGSGASEGAGMQTRVELSRLVEGEVLQFESVAFERDVTFASDIGAGIEVQGNIQRLQRLVGALLDNACKYTEAGGLVSVTLARDGGEAVLAVNNTGAPIAAEDLPHLFDRFYRADKARTQSDAGGFGLGLSIAKDIAQDHGGSIAVSSAEGFGTTFTVRLPLA